MDGIKGGILRTTDYFIGTDQTPDGTGGVNNVTRNYLVSEVINTILGQELNIGTVTSVAIANSTYINLTGGPITTIGTLSGDLNATGTKNTTTFLRGDNSFSLPGPAPNTVSVFFNGTLLTNTVTSINYTGNTTATGALSNILVDMPGSTSTIDNVIAGTALSINAPTGNVTVTNTGVLLAQAGGNVTLSGGTGGVTVNTTANPASLVQLNAGAGIATIVNSTTNAIMALSLTGGNNYITQSQDAVAVNAADFVEFNQITSNNVKSVKIEDVPTNVFTAIKKYIDDADKNVLKNTTDTFSSTARTNNMVSLTAAEYVGLQNAGTIDENTLYFILGGGVPFTVSLSVNNTIGGGTGTSTTPSSFSGIVGAAYSFSTTITNLGTQSYNPGNLPLTTTGNIVNNAGNPYTVSVTATGSTTAAVIDTGQAVLAVSAIGDNIGTGLNNNTPAVWGFKNSNSEPGDTSTENFTGNFTFNAEIEIVDSNYLFAGGGPRYQTTLGGSIFSQSAPVNYSGTVGLTPPGSTPTTVTQTIKGGYILKTFTFGYTQVNNIIDSTGTAGGGVDTEYSLSYVGTATGTYDINTVIPVGTLTATAISPFQFVGGASQVVVTYASFPLTANATETLTITGTMEDTTPALADMVLAYTDNISGTGGEGVAYTLNPTTAAVTAGTIGAFGVSVGSGYSIIQPTATIISGSGFFFSSGMTATVTPGSNALVANMPAGGGIANQTLTGTIANNTCTYRIEQVAVPVGGAITYQTTFSSSAFTGTFATTNSAIVNKGSQNPGNGNVTVTVNRTSPSTQAQDAGSIQWYLNGALKNSFTIQVGQSVSQSFTVTGVGNGDTVLVIISEG